MEGYMTSLDTPGGALAVVKDRRLVYVRGYGWANGERQLPVDPDSLFRIASLTKPMTAVAVLRLVEQGKLRLDTRPFELLTLHRLVPPGKHLDERWKQITVRHLLQHTGGWDREKSFDPMFRSKQIAKDLNAPAPPSAHDVIRYMLGQPLDFDPGARYAYSNFGYCVLGRVIEFATGQPYERYVAQQILRPIGITRMKIGASLDGKQAEGEVRYYMPVPSSTESVFPEHTAKVSAPYGGFYLEAMDSHGGWIGSVIDLARFVAALDDFQRSPLLKEETLHLMVAPPERPVSRKSNGELMDAYYGCGWMVRPIRSTGGVNFWHAGSLPGTYSLLARRHDGVSFAVLFNQRSKRGQKADAEIDGALNRAVDSVSTWPAVDLFRSGSEEAASGSAEAVIR
jgi:N-acyl-D-amino-acid deacylase